MSSQAAAATDSCQDAEVKIQHWVAGRRKKHILSCLLGLVHIANFSFAESLSLKLREVEPDAKTLIKM